MMVSRDKIRGMFLGTGIGDAFAMPFESKPYNSLKSVKRIADYSVGRMPKGTYTDDTQLTIATAQAILETGCIDMRAIGRHHVKAYKETTSGWGGTTRDAVRKISEGVDWSEAGHFAGATNRGFGNGVVMKVSPLVAYFALTGRTSQLSEHLVDFTAMTHQTSVAVSGTFAQAIALLECLTTDQSTFNVRTFLKKVTRASEVGRAYFADTLKDDLTNCLKTLLPLYENSRQLYDIEHVVEKYNNGSCYVYDSLPMTYAFFIKGPFDIRTMFDIAYAGGDTDSNASMVAALQGALLGTKVFPEHLYHGLKNGEQILKLADDFYDRFC